MAKHLILMQIKTLFWKNCVTRKHEVISTIMQILLPCVLVIILTRVISFFDPAIDLKVNKQLRGYFTPNTNSTAQMMKTVKKLSALEYIRRMSSITQLYQRRADNRNAALISFRNFSNRDPLEPDYDIRPSNNLEWHSNSIEQIKRTKRHEFKISYIVKLLLTDITMQGYLFILPMILVPIIDEKRNGIKELMKIMGLKQWILWIGYFGDAIVLGSITTFINVYHYITPFKVNSDSLLQYCNGFLLFMFLLLYFISFVTFAFAMSTLFYNSTWGSIISMFLFITSLELPRRILSKSISFQTKILLALLPNVSLYFGFQQIHTYDLLRTTLDWNNASSAKAEGLSLKMVLLMFLIDIVFYMLISLYAENIMPGPYGIAKPLCYPCKYFCKKTQEVTNEEDETESVTRPSYFRMDAPPNLPVGIDVRNLTQEFGNFVALDNLNLKVYRGEITVLLGHNGAGKTTFMSILTGILRPTRGRILVNGKSIKHNMDEIRQSLGICMQHDINFPKLTVLEHLLFFGMIKGLSKARVRDKANSYMDAIRIAHRKKYVPGKLSGGQKRKLSLGIALIGDPELLILDEPSTGIDPESRREIWDILLSSRRTRTVIITTHFMEEADVLGDRVTILHEGQLVCFGSPFYLKKEFGSGYHLMLLCNNVTNKTKDITNLVQKNIPKATLRNTSSNSLTYVLPQEDKGPFGRLFGDIERNKSSLNIVGMSLTITTMEDVFLRVEELIGEAEEQTSEVTIISGEQFESGAGLEVLRQKPPISDSDKMGPPLIYLLMFYSLCKKRLRVAFRDWFFHLGQLLLLCAITLFCLRSGQNKFWTLVFPLGLFMITGRFLFFPHRERVSNMKQLQLMCGVPAIEYWLVLVIWDLIFFLIAVICIYLVFDWDSAFHKNIFEADWQKDWLFTTLMAYVIPMILFTYHFSYFKTGTRGFMVLLISSLFLDFLLATVVFVVSEIFGNKEQTQMFFKFFQYLHPQMCLIELMNLFVQMNSSKEVEEDININVSSKHWILLKSVVFYTITLTLLNWKLINLYWEKCSALFYKRLRYIFKRGTFVVPNIKNQDVLKEKERISNIYSIEKENPDESLSSYLNKKDVDLLLVGNLHKSYKGKKVVDGISFSIKPGNCFGLLGVNGAGKSTTFGMLTGYTTIPIGDARIYRKDDFIYITQHSRKFLKCVGYCPQGNAIVPSLTGREMLHLMAELRGLHNRSDEVEILINALGLEKHAHRRCGTYSGGNKRKLGIAMALIGDPMVVFLDEPTSGVDPVSSRKMRDTISAILKREVKPSIVLTSHSMDECEALCNTLGIMKSGQLACFGEIPKLKGQYGSGFIVLFKIKIYVVDQVVDTYQEGPSQWTHSTKLKAFMRAFESNYEGNFILADKHEGLLQYRITDKKKTWSTLFPEIEQLKDQHKIIEDYNISEITLEEIFLTIARS